MQFIIQFLFMFIVFFLILLYITLRLAPTVLKTKKEKQDYIEAKRIQEKVRIKFDQAEKRIINDEMIQNVHKNVKDIFQEDIVQKRKNNLKLIEYEISEYKKYVIDKEYERHKIKNKLKEEINFINPIKKAIVINNKISTLLEEKIYELENQEKEKEKNYYKEQNEIKTKSDTRSLEQYKEKLFEIECLDVWNDEFINEKLKEIEKLGIFKKKISFLSNEIKDNTVEIKYVVRDNSIINRNEIVHLKTKSKLIEKTDKQIREEYFNYILSYTIFIVSEVFNISKSIEYVSTIIFKEDDMSKSNKVRKIFIIRFDRNNFWDIKYSLIELKYIFKRFEHEKNMTSTYLIKEIT